MNTEFTAKIMAQNIDLEALVQIQADRIAELEKEADRLSSHANELRKIHADRIAELEKLLEHSVGSDCREMRYVQEIENKDARIAELTQKLSAYIIELELQKAMIQDLEKELKRTKFAWNLAENEIERLSSQTKPLSDEEIETIYLKTLNKFEFARAIEERHGIK